LHKLDKYILKEMIGPFVFGVGAFIIVLVSVDLLYDALRLIVREGYPVGLVARAFVYRMPQTITLTLPMATMFGALMAIGRLSSDGEVEAMRAGGVSFPRLAAPVLAGGLLVSALGLVLNEVVVPPANNAANQLLVELAEGVVARQDYLFLSLPEKEAPHILLKAEHFNAENGQLRDVWIARFHNGDFADYFTAEEAVWRGTKVIMRNAVHVTYLSDGSRRTEQGMTATTEVGRAPWQVRNLAKSLEDMTLVELKQDIVRMRQLPASAREKLPELVEYFHMRLAIPWSALGFAIIAAPLAVRPKRTTTGVGLGISLAIILAYYVIFNALRVVGEQGALPPALAAWLPNMILYGVGLGLLIDASR